MNPRKFMYKSKNPLTKVFTTKIKAAKAYRLFIKAEGRVKRWASYAEELCRQGVLKLAWHKGQETGYGVIKASEDGWYFIVNSDRIPGVP